jgi:uncharacterized protein YbaA (DUF1428 family)
MAYFQAFLIPVPESRKDAYSRMAHDVAPLFQEYGAERIVECWDDEVPRGQTTDMYRAVRAEAGERVVFSWIDWASREACDKAHDQMMSDERMQDPPDAMPFDGMRLTFAGFETLGAAGAGGSTGYVAGYVAPVRRERRKAFADMCATMRDVAIRCGALYAVDGWAENIEDGTLTDFKRAVKAESGEAVAFGYVEWASKAAWDQGSARMRQDDDRPPSGADLPLDGKRLIHGGFSVLLDTGALPQ